jgi:hypothetical protein
MAQQPTTYSSVGGTQNSRDRGHVISRIRHFDNALIFSLRKSPRHRRASSGQWPVNAAALRRRSAFDRL